MAINTGFFDYLGGYGDANTVYRQTLPDGSERAWRQIRPGIFDIVETANDGTTRVRREKVPPNPYEQNLVTEYIPQTPQYAYTPQYMPQQLASTSGAVLMSRGSMPMWENVPVSAPAVEAPVVEKSPEEKMEEALDAAVRAARGAA